MIWDADDLEWPYTHRLGAGWALLAVLCYRVAQAFGEG